MADYRCLAQPLRPFGATKTLPLVLRDLRFTLSANSPGSWSGTLVLDEDDVEGVAELLDMLDPGATAIFAERDGDIVYPGILWRDDYSGGDASMPLSGADLLSYYEHRIVDFTKVYTNTEQLAIIRDTLTRTDGTLTGAGGIGLVADTAVSGILRQDTYDNTSGRTVLDHWFGLANSDNGFEMTTTAEWGGVGGANIIRRLRLGYPRLQVPGGAPLGLTYVRPGADNFAAESAANVASYRWPRDGATRTTRGIAIAPQADGTTAVTRTSATTAINAGAPVLDKSKTLDGVSRQATIDAHAASLLAIYGDRPEPSFTVAINDDDPEGPTGQCAPGRWAVGTEVQVTIIDPVRFPNSVGDPVAYRGRIESADVTTSPIEQVTFTVPPLPGEVIRW